MKHKQQNQSLTNNATTCLYTKLHLSLLPLCYLGAVTGACWRNLYGLYVEVGQHSEISKKYKQNIKCYIIELLQNALLFLLCLFFIIFSFILGTKLINDLTLASLIKLASLVSGVLLIMITF